MNVNEFNCFRFIFPRWCLYTVWIHRMGVHRLSPYGYLFKNSMFTLPDEEKQIAHLTLHLTPLFSPKKRRLSHFLDVVATVITPSCLNDDDCAFCCVSVFAFSQTENRAY